MLTVLIHEQGRTTSVGGIEPAWLDRQPGRPLVWVDIVSPTDADLRVLSEVFRFHPLAVDDARSALQFPKVELYEDVLYLVLHAIDQAPARETLVTGDIDFFLGPTFLVTVHASETHGIAGLRQVCERHTHAWADGAVGLLHRIVDGLVDGYRPAMDALEQRVERAEEEAFGARDRQIVRGVLRLRRELAAMRRVLIPQRDVLGRLARREFSMIDHEMAYRFRDVHDHVVRLADETMMLQDRMTGIQEVHLAAVSNRLNEVMKVMTAISTVYLPLTVLTGMWGMNVALPVLPGGPAAQFWWIVGGLVALSAVMLGLFRLRRWL